MQSLSISDIICATGGKAVCDIGDISINEITTDSRKAGEGILFIPLKGENADGHDFIKSATEKGAVSLSEKETDVCGPIIRVSDTKKALGDIAKYYKAKYPLKTVAITGSVGKTTTKDLVYSVIKERYVTHKTPNNFNNDIGVPLTIFGIEKEHQAAVIEMGMNHFGEISYLANIVMPDCAVITNVGMSHIENLGSQEGILKAKMEIAEQFNEDNTLFVNGDNKFLNSINNTPYKLVKFGLNEKNDVYAKNVVNNGLSGVEFDIVYQNDEFHASVKQPGVHNVYNALSAVCVGLHMGLTEEECIRGLANCEYTSARLEVIEHNGIEIINDCYNSSPDSVRAALKVMGESLKPRKVAVLGDILEMGEYAKDAHYCLGKSVVDAGVDMLITAGENARFIAQGASDNGMENIASFDTTAELKDTISELVGDGDCVLIKASHGMKFIDITETITAL